MAIILDSVTIDVFFMYSDVLFSTKLIDLWLESETFILTLLGIGQIYADHRSHFFESWVECSFGFWSRLSLTVILNEPDYAFNMVSILNLSFPETMSETKFFILSLAISSVTVVLVLFLGTILLSSSLVVA